MYKHDLFYLQQSLEACFVFIDRCTVYKHIRTTESQLTQSVYKILMLLKLTSEHKVHAPTVKMVHNNYNTRFDMRSKTHSKTSNKTISVNFRLGRVI